MFQRNHHLKESIRIPGVIFESLKLAVRCWAVCNAVVLHCRWEEPRGPRWVKVGQAQEDEERRMFCKCFLGVTCVSRRKTINFIIFYSIYQFLGDSVWPPTNHWHVQDSIPVGRSRKVAVRVEPKLLAFGTAALTCSNVATGFKHSFRQSFEISLKWILFICVGGRCVPKMPRWSDLSGRRKERWAASNSPAIWWCRHCSLVATNETRGGWLEWMSCIVLAWDHLIDAD